MGDRTCPIETDGETCGKPSFRTDSRNWCPMHRNRWYRHGDVHYLSKFGIPRGATEEERFWSKVDAEGDCWIWIGAIGNHGYGVFCETGARSGQRKTRTAHRYAYEALVGPIPDGMTLDHLCRTRPCLNPDHLEICSLSENVRRAQAGRAKLRPKPQKVRKERQPRTHCRQGHPFSGDNLYVVPGRGQRTCRTCKAANGRERYLATKAAKAA